MTMSGSKKLFLSAVTSEFGAYRTLLSQDLKRPTLAVHVQEDFVVTGGKTMAKLDAYLRECDGVIHLVGKATGAAPSAAEVATLLATYPDFGARLPPLAAALRNTQPGLSYTQWEAYLALYHGKPLFVYRPTDFELDSLHVPRGALFARDAAQEQAQREHYCRLCDLGHDRGQFLNEERLSSAVLRDLVEILPRLEPSIDVPPTRLRHTAERLIGRDLELTRLDAAWNNPQCNVVVVRAFGGMGKTSLVATWMAELAAKNWRGAERVYDWSFYSQGTNDQRAASADHFMAIALKEFGDPDPRLGSAWDRGARLAALVRASRCLLVLDGVEPLQYPPGPMHGKFKDPGIEALLKGLVGLNPGLCVVTTREKVVDIQQHYGRSADDMDLVALTDLAGAALLHHAGARRAGAKAVPADHAELQAASREVRGHGLTLQLLGKYLRLAEGGDIRKRDTVKLVDAEREYKNDATRPYGHAFKAMEAYERWFEREGAAGAQQLATLRLLGLFDRPASADCLEALRAAPPIAGLTEALVGTSEREWNVALKRLEEIQLVTLMADGALDAHPLLREYFAMRVRQQQPAAWKEGHRRVYEHLCEHTKEGAAPSLADLQPLYQAVAHGCQAGLQQKALEEVFRARVMRHERYSELKLGAVSDDLCAIAAFFESPWTRVSRGLSPSDTAWLRGGAAHCLGSLGRVSEALDVERSALDAHTNTGSWREVSIHAGNLSQIQLLLGDVAGAIRNAELSVAYADRSGDVFKQVSTRTTLAYAMHQAGYCDQARKLFSGAEDRFVRSGPGRHFLCTLGGFWFCDVLLADSASDSWRRTIGLPLKSRAITVRPSESVEDRATIDLRLATLQGWLIDVARDNLTLGCAALYGSILQGTPRTRCSVLLSLAVDGFRRSGRWDSLPLGLLARSWLRGLSGPRTGPDSAQADLDEAYEIAERGPMPLFQADIHLHRARLFAFNADGTRATTYPWQSAAHDLAEARRLIEKHGYGRRGPELEDAEAAILPPRKP